MREAVTLEGRILQRYRVLRQIGEGGMGRVYLARDERLDRDVALKTIRVPGGADSASRARFEREIRAGTAVEHPFVAKVFDAIEHDGTPILVMEYLDGVTLDRAIRERGAFDLHMALRLGIEIAEALAAIHARGIVHRDVKPGNVMLSASGHVKVMDFGVARLAAPPPVNDASATTVTHLTRPGMLIGTPAYLPPEVLLGGQQTPRGDLFALGIVMWELLIGRHPFKRATPPETQDAILYDAPGAGDESSLQAFAKLPEPVRSVLDALLAKRPADRLPTAERAGTSMRDALASLLEAPRRVRVRRALLVASALALGAISAVVAWRAMPPTTDDASIAPQDAPPVVAVLPFDDRTGDPDAAHRGEMIAALLAAGLGESGAVRALGPERMSMVAEGTRSTASSREQVGAARQLTRADIVVLGTIMREAGELGARVQVHREGDDAFSTVRSRGSSATRVAEMAIQEVLSVLQVDLAIAGGRRQENAALPDGAVELILDARRLVREIEYESAISAAEAALRAVPSSLEAATTLADVLFTAGFEDRARDVVRDAARLVGSGPAAGSALEWEFRAVEARVLGRLKDEAVARAELKKLVPYDGEIRSALARSLAAVGSYEEALAEIDAAIALDRLDPRLHVSRTRLLARMRRLDDAMSAIEEARRLFGLLGNGAGRAEIRVVEAELLEARERFGDARDRFLAAAAIYEREGSLVRAAMARRSAGQMAVHAWDVEGAVALLESTLEPLKAAGNYRALVQVANGLASAYFRLGRYDDAQRHLREGLLQADMLGMERVKQFLLANLAMYGNAANRTDEARHWAGALRELAEQRADARTALTARGELAEANRRDGRFAESIREFEEILAERVSLQGATVQETVWMLQKLTRAHRDAGDLERATRVASEAIDASRRAGLIPSLAFSLALRASIAATRGDVASAEADMAEMRGLGEAVPDAPEFQHVALLARSAIATSLGDDAEIERVALALAAPLRREDPNGAALNVIEYWRNRNTRPEWLLDLAAHIDNEWLTHAQRERLRQSEGRVAGESRAPARRVAREDRR